MLRHAIACGSRLSSKLLASSLPSQPAERGHKFLLKVSTVRQFASDNRTPESRPHNTEIPIPKESPITPGNRPGEVPKINRSRPLPPPAYAASRLDQVSKQDTEEALSFKRDPSENNAYKLDDNERTTNCEKPKSGADIREMNYQFNQQSNSSVNEFDKRSKWSKFDGHGQEGQEKRQKITGQANLDKQAVYDDMQTIKERDLAKMRAMGLLGEDESEKDILDDQEKSK